MADQVFWNRDSEQDRKRFAVLLMPLVGASRTKTFTRHEGTAYLLSMQDVPPAILEEAVIELVRKGVTWMPKPGDLKAECARVMAAKRDAAFRLHIEGCDHSGHFEEVTGADGVIRNARCGCWKRAKAAADQVGQAIALPPSREDQMELGQ